MENIIIAIIPAIIPALVTIISNSQLKRTNDMHSARQSILQLIVEDHIRVNEGNLPENFKAICSEYDEYKKNGGNSYITGKVERYFKWYEEAIPKSKIKELNK